MYNETNVDVLFPTELRPCQVLCDIVGDQINVPQVVIEATKITPDGVRMRRDEHIISVYKYNPYKIQIV